MSADHDRRRSERSLSSRLHGPDVTAPGTSALAICTTTGQLRLYRPRLRCLPAPGSDFYCPSWLNAVAKGIPARRFAMSVCVFVRGDSLSLIQVLTSRAAWQ